MGSKLSQYDYSILTLKCVNLIQEKTITIITAKICARYSAALKGCT